MSQCDTTQQFAGAAPAPVFAERWMVAEARRSAATEGAAAVADVTFIDFEASLAEARDEARERERSATEPDPGTAMQPSVAGVEAVPILAAPEWLDSASLRRFQRTGLLAEGKRCHTNKVPCHTDLEKRFADFLDGAKDVVRYFKNERLGFSVTYSEGGRPRQYFPDFIIAARESDGREVMWLAETKGEMRLNTPLKSEAARAWCEKMSGTRYDQWRFLFLQQKKLERILAAGVSSLAELAESPGAGTGRASTEAAGFRRGAGAAGRLQEGAASVLPKAAAGYFGQGESVEPEGGIEAEGLGRLSEQMFVCRAVGRSMEPAIRDGDFLVFRAKPAGSRSGKTVLVQYRGPADPDTDGAFTVKRYSSVRRQQTETAGATPV